MIDSRGFGDVGVDSFKSNMEIVLEVERYLPSNVASLSNIFFCFNLQKFGPMERKSVEDVLEHFGPRMRKVLLIKIEFSSVKRASQNT